MAKIKVKVKKESDGGKYTLPSVTVTGVRKKAEPAKEIPTKATKSYGVTWKSGETTKMSEEDMKKVMYKKD